MMKRIVFMMAILVCVGTAAQTSKEARKILDKTAATISSKGGAYAKFTISNVKSGSTNGTIYIKGNMFKAITPEATVWFNGKTQWSYMSQTEEVNITTPTREEQMAMNPYTFINLYKQGYNLSKENKGGNYNIHLVATDKKMGIQEMYISVNQKTFVPTSVRMRQGGDWTTINISNFKKSVLASSIFVFNKSEYPNAEVVDLR